MGLSEKDGISVEALLKTGSADSLLAELYRVMEVLEFLREVGHRLGGSLTPGLIEEINSEVGRLTRI